MKHVLLVFCFLLATQSAHAATSSCIRGVSDQAVFTVQSIVTDTTSFTDPSADTWMNLQVGYGWIGSSSPFSIPIDIEYSSVNKMGDLYISTGIGHFTVEEFCDAKEKIEDYIAKNGLTGFQAEAFIFLYDSIGSGGTGGGGTSLDNLIKKIEDAKKNNSYPKFTYKYEFDRYNVESMLTLIEM